MNNHYNNKVLTRASEIINAKKARSAWEQGVRYYAEDLLYDLDEAISADYFAAEDLASPRMVEREMLNGASDWKEYSEGGCSLCYDGHIAERLCAPWELRKTDNGRKDPNPQETWIDVQSRALYQASQIAKSAINAAVHEIH